MTDLLEYVFIELPKFTETNKEYNNKLYKWLIFLSNPTGKEIEEFIWFENSAHFPQYTENDKFCDLLLNISNKL